MRADAPISSNSEATLPLVRKRCASIAIAGLLLGAMLWPLWRSAGEGASGVGLAPTCARWDDLARESVARLLQNGKHDADLRRANDAIFRLRRARRNCSAGWTALACQDYLAVAHGTPATAESRPPHEPGCTMARVDETGTAR
jgi:hypothetical protein